MMITLSIFKKGSRMTLNDVAVIVLNWAKNKAITIAQGVVKTPVLSIQVKSVTVGAIEFQCKFDKLQIVNVTVNVPTAEKLVKYTLDIKEKGMEETAESILKLMEKEGFKI